MMEVSEEVASSSKVAPKRKSEEGMHMQGVKKKKGPQGQKNPVQLLNETIGPQEYTFTSQGMILLQCM